MSTPRTKEQMEQDAAVCAFALTCSFNLAKLKNTLEGCAKDDMPEDSVKAFAAWLDQGDKALIMLIDEYVDTEMAE